MLFAFGNPSFEGSAFTTWAAVGPGMSVPAAGRRHRFGYTMAEAHVSTVVVFFRFCQLLRARCIGHMQLLITGGLFVKVLRWQQDTTWRMGDPRHCATNLPMFLSQQGYIYLFSDYFLVFVFFHYVVSAGSQNSSKILQGMWARSWQPVFFM